jgi:inner membrane protein
VDNLFDIWSSMGAWRWLTLAALLVAVELGTGTTWFLWFAVAAGLTGLVVALPGDLPIAWELITFAALSVATAMMGRRVIKPGWLRSEQPALNDPSHRLVGTRATVATAFEYGEGRVSLGDTQWRAVLDGGGSLPVGTSVEVVGVDGGTVSVRRMEAPALLTETPSSA